MSGQIRVCFADSIKSRIETTRNEVRQMEGREFVLLIPLNQGLKQVGASSVPVTVSVCFADSIKSRIETN